MRRKLPRSDLRVSSAICPASSMPVGPAPDDHECQPGSAQVWISLALGHLEGAEDPSAQLECVVDRLHPRRVALELRMAEVRLVRTARENQGVVRNLAAQAKRVDAQAACIEVDRLDVSEHHGRVSLAAQNVPHRRGDIALGKDAGSHLVQQRLKQVVVRSVDHRHLDISPPQGLRGE